MKTIIRIFVDFLYDKRIFDKAVSYCLRGIMDCVAVEAPEDYLLVLFRFDRTEEGEDFWWDKHRMWMDCLKENGYVIPENYG